MQECNVALSSVGVGSRVGGEAVSPHKRGIDIVQDICPYFSALWTNGAVSESFRFVIELRDTHGAPLGHYSSL